MGAIQAQGAKRAGRKHGRIWRVKPVAKSQVFTYGWIIRNWDRQFGCVEEVMVLRDGKAKVIVGDAPDPPF